MIDFFTLFKAQILSFLNFLLPVMIISFMSLGIVSVFGRLWEITNTDHAKNILASISLLALSFLYQKSFIISYDLIWNTIELFTLSAIFYIGFCWRFYSRLDAILDKWFGKDKFKPTVKKKRKNKK